MTVSLNNDYSTTQKITVLILFAGIGDLDDFGSFPANVKSPREKDKNRKTASERNLSKINSL